MGRKKGSRGRREGGKVRGRDGGGDGRWEVKVEKGMEGRLERMKEG